MLSLIADIISIIVFIKDFIIKIFEIVFYEQILIRIILRKKFYYKEYTRHVTLYPDGHSIIIDSSIVKVLSPKDLTSIERIITLQDTKEGVVFDDFDIMAERHRNVRFSNKGFWFLSSSFNEISLVKNVNGSIENNGKTLKLKFDIDERVYEKNKRIAKFCYAYSIPGLYPIESGLRDCRNITDKNPYDTSICFKTPIKKLIFIVSFDKDIAVCNNPNIHILKKIKVKENKHIEGEKEKGIKKFDFIDDIFYNKYLGVIKYPRNGYIYKAGWDISNIRRKR